MKLGLFVLTLLSACGPTTRRLPTVTLTIDGHSVRAEVAATEDERARGLMFRDHLGAEDGMLFVYKDEKPRGFWMKDTRIPLDIAYLDSAGKILRIVSMKPLSTESVPSVFPARYALEMNKGWFEGKGVKVGALVDGVKTAAP